jgi:phosphatidylglycerol:prolipoprotein diacylglycerol transferase
MIYCKIRHIRVKDFADSFAVGIPLFHAFGRLGCFLSGCCYGIESTFGFTATNALVDSCNNVNRFPVQLLEGGLNIILFVVLLLLFKSENFKGSMIFVYLAGYSIIRFFDEFLRGDIYRGIWLGLSTSQWISVVLFAVSIVVLIRFFKNKQKVEFVYRG